MTDAEIIKGLECCTTTCCKVCPLKGCYTCYEELSENALALIERLQERVAIQREPCKYCNQDNTDRAVHSANGEHWITVGLPSECESESMDIPINNCPMCGRKLKGEQG